jgi:hypothetical protein
MATFFPLRSRRDREHPQTQHLNQRVVNPGRIAVVGQACRQSRGDSQAPLHTAQQQHTRVG